ncbi:MAG: DUF4040 domain-containing protein [Phycisphaerales bacterium]|nr:MAG: DUF4040 domain-containing protein [Phycisphaerales bacterium]
MIIGSIAIIALAALLAPWLHRWLGWRAGYVLALAPAAGFVYYARELMGVAEGRALVSTLEWLPELGVSLGFRVDGLSMLFCLLITGIGTFVLMYATPYMKDYALRGRFFSYLLGFMGSMLGLVVADNVILLFIFWELTSITSYLLIGFDHDRLAARKAALQALLTTGLGGLALLAGLILLATAAGTYEISRMGPISGDHPLYVGALVCILAGCFTKSAQFPFHYWLPNAMEAPSPVSAFLHSSTMVKAGVFLLAKLNPIMGETALWDTLLVGFGGFTMLFAAYLATRKTELKPVLAYSTVSSLGIITMLIGVGGTYGTLAAMGYLFAHALFKAALFLIAGIVVHATHEKNTEKLGGLARAMPFTALAAVVAGLSLAGAPPMLGFVGKELLLKAGLGSANAIPAIAIASVTGVAAALTVMAAFVVVWKPFFGRKPEHAGHAHDDAANNDDASNDHGHHGHGDHAPHEAPFTMWIGPITLGVLTILGALLPVYFVDAVVKSAAHDVLHNAAAIEPVARTVYEGTSLAAFDMLYISTPLLISLGALAVGLVLYVLRKPYRATTELLAPIDRVGPLRMYHWALDGVVALAKRQTRFLQNGSLPIYLRFVVTAMLVLVGVALLRTGGLGTLRNDLDDLGIVEGILVLMMIAAAYATTRQRSRLATIAILGIVGYAVALIFVLFGAPDVSMTQFAVETLTVVLFVLVVYHLPRFALFSNRATRLMDALIASVAGLAVGALVLASSAETSIAPISWYFNEHAYPAEGDPAGRHYAYGRNLVNVILVDFRSMDTLGEITVLGIAAIGVFTLLRLRPDREPFAEPTGAATFGADEPDHKRASQGEGERPHREGSA